MDAKIKRQFLNLQTTQDVSVLLNTEHKHLIYYLYILNKSQRYLTFEIPKRSGGTRTISSPATPLKLIQKRLNIILSQLVEYKHFVYSYSPGKNVVDNAKVHLKNRILLNIDLLDFFPSINFGRVRGMFMAHPYNLNEKVSTILAQICCHDNQLPQGAPTSPIISNMICAKMDDQLFRLAKTHRCKYTRYADDIALSTKSAQFPDELAIAAQRGKNIVGNLVEEIISANGFSINYNKVHLRKRCQRQEVTGIVINSLPNTRRSYIKQMRSMIYAWQKHGLKKAEREHFKKYSTKHRHSSKGKPSYKQILKGMLAYLGMVRGKNDSYYQLYSKQLKELDPKLIKLSDINFGMQRDNTIPTIYTEGKTDWKHLKAALRNLRDQGKYLFLDIMFFESEEDMGDGCLKKESERQAKTNSEGIKIFIFDRDKKDTIKFAQGTDKPYKPLGNYTYALLIPVPSHRIDNPKLCLELYYSDRDLTIKDEHGRRIYLNREFDQRSGRHSSEDLNCTLTNLIKKKELKILTDAVFNKARANVALSKNDFAINILERKNNFKDVDFGEFEKIFDIIQMIMNDVRALNA